MKTVLAVIFLVNGEPTILYDGFQPREQPNMEVCKERAAFMTEYLEQDPNMPEVAEIICGDAAFIQSRIDVLKDSIL